MKKGTISWRGIIFSISIALLVFLNVFVILVRDSYSKELSHAYEIENRRAVQSWETMLASRLDTYSGHIRELSKYIYSSTELRPGSPSMGFILRKNLADLMTYKLGIDSGLDIMFILTEDGNPPIICAQNYGSSGEWNSYVIAAKRFLNAGSYPTSSIWGQDWSLVQIEGTPCLFRVITLGKYRVGALGRLTNFDMTQQMHILGAHYSCALISDGAVYHMAGEDWGDDLHLDDNGQPQAAWDASFLEADASALDARLLLAVRSGDTAPLYTAALKLLLATGLMCICLVLLLIFVLYRMVSKPVRAMLDATDRVKSGDLTYQMEEHWGNQEFDALSASFNAMVGSIHQFRIEAYDRELQKRQDELTMLRAQIQPHFYLNAITTISNMTYQNRNEEIRKYIAALAKFIRYMLNLQCKQVLISDELAHIDNYLKMQAIRFPNSVQVETYLDPKAEQLEIPYLLLFTVVENTFKHAMDLYSTLRLRICCEAVEEAHFHGFRIRVQDNGKGFSQEVLDRIRQEVSPANPKEHLGLTNVRRTLMLTYGRDDLLRLSNLPEGGAQVEIWIPSTTTEKGAAQT